MTDVSHALRKWYLEAGEYDFLPGGEWYSGLRPEYS